MAMLYHCIYFVMVSWEKCALDGLICKKKDEGAILLLLIIESYILDIPESENLLNMKENVELPAMSCHVSAVNKEMLAGRSVVTKHRSKRLVKLFSNSAHAIETTKSQRYHFKEMFILLLNPALVEFSLTGIRSSVNSCSISSTESLHNLILEISWLFMKVTRNVLSSERREISTVRQKFWLW